LNTLIVGASSGIGKECARTFAKKGHRIICSARDQDELDRVASDLSIRYGCQASVMAIDLSEPSEIGSFVDKIYAEIKYLDNVIVTAATLPADGSDVGLNTDLAEVTRTNYVGVAVLIGAISTKMVERGSGTIVCLSSVAGDRGRQSNFVYGATKSALNTFLQGLRMKLDKYGIRVITVMPGYVDTLMAYGRVRSGLSVSPSYFAKRIYRLTRTRRNIVYVPGVWWLVGAVLKSIPESIYKKMRI
jgi:short-subunit dehydrogenase